MADKPPSEEERVSIIDAACQALKSSDLDRNELAQRIIDIVGSGTPDSVMFELRHGVLRGLISRPAPGMYHLTKRGQEMLRDQELN